MTDWRSTLPPAPAEFDPRDDAQVEEFIREYNIEVEAEPDGPLPGWGVLWKGGGGIFCPFINGDSDGRKARAIIACACYLHLVGVNVALTNEMAYWFVLGSKGGAHNG